MGVVGDRINSREGEQGWGGGGHSNMSDTQDTCTGKYYSG